MLRYISERVEIRRRFTGGWRAPQHGIQNMYEIAYLSAYCDKPARDGVLLFERNIRSVPPVPPGKASTPIADHQERCPIIVFCEGPRRGIAIADLRQHLGPRSDAGLRFGNGPQVFNGSPAVVGDLGRGERLEMHLSRP
jgi:hypothetical protein